jgi:DNA uptake protein ComE-like DNA-binding protein
MGMTIFSRVVLEWVLDKTQVLVRTTLKGIDALGDRGQHLGGQRFEDQRYDSGSSASRSRPIMPWQLLRQKITNDPYYRFQSLAEIRIAAEHGIRIDVNTANLDDWLRLPGLSIHQARLLTQLTESGVQFYCVEDVAAALGTSMQRLKPLEPILQFCYYDLESLSAIDRVSLNMAPPESLQQLPGVGPVLARAIVRDRTSRGDFRNLVDLQERLSLPNSLTADLMHYLKF